MRQESLFGDNRTQVVNIKLEPYDVYCGRPRGPRDPQDCAIGEDGWLGNPWDIRVYPDAIKLFQNYFLSRVDSDLKFREAVLRCRGKKLGCFCVSLKRTGVCHVRTVIDWIERQPPI